MSAIAKTASITLITGVPGNGKSLRAVWYMRQAVKEGEQVYACNVNGLRIDGVNEWQDPTLWEALPAGAILVVDEAQKFFRAGLTETYIDEAGKPKTRVPMFIQNMETIRHSGIRLILITQSPALLHGNIRALVGLHEHLVRQGGKPLATVYRRSRVMDNVRSEKSLAAEDHESWGFPTQEYDSYDSAEKHTVKRTVSSKYKRGMVLACIAACLIGYAIWNGKRLAGGGEEASVAGSGQTAAQAAGGLLPGSRSDEEAPKWASPYEYAKQHLPRFPTMPWTAEIFDQRSVMSDPEIYCMSSKPGSDANGDEQDFSCTCLTEQSTVVDMDMPSCLKLARRGGEYNPYRQKQPQQVAQAPAEDRAAESSMVPASVVLPGTQVASYGDIAVPVVK